MKKKVIAILVAVLAIFLLSMSGCYNASVSQCMEEHPGCRWNCQLQYGWATDDVVAKASVERCHW